jgi:hypothetical protein
VNIARQRTAGARLKKEVDLKIKAKILHPFQHDRFYKQGEVVEMHKPMFDDLLPQGLVEEVKVRTSEDVETKTTRKAK